MFEETANPENQLDEKKSKEYSRIKIQLSIIDIIISILFITVLAFSGISSLIVKELSIVSGNEYIQFLLFLLVAGLAMGAVTMPLDFFSGYIIEHRYGLSNQSILKWAVEKFKSTAVSLVIGVPLALVFFYFLKIAGALWWLYFSILVFLLAIVLARLAPVVIFPLFYKFSPLDNEEIKSVINNILTNNNISIQGIFSFNMSKDTRKANAGFTGIGKSRRIILSDTLVENFTPREIGVIFAHEVGHYVKKHIAKDIALSGITIFLSFFLCGMLYDWTIHIMGFASIHNIAAIPVLFFYLVLLSVIMMPLNNLISRKFERESDLYALQNTGDRDAFISSMEKFSRINLSDREPHPVLEFLFHSHPSIGRRIEFAQKAEL